MHTNRCGSLLPAAPPCCSHRPPHPPQINQIYKDLTRSGTHPLGGQAYLHLESEEEPYSGGWTGGRAGGRTGGGVGRACGQHGGGWMGGRAGGRGNREGAAEGGAG